MVRLLSAATGAFIRDVNPFGDYTGGVRVAVAASAGHFGVFVLIDGRTGAVGAPVAPFGAFPGGREVATGDVDHDVRVQRPNRRDHPRVRDVPQGGDRRPAGGG